MLEWNQCKMQGIIRDSMSLTPNASLTPESTLKIMSTFLYLKCLNGINAKCKGS